ncbi:hypothetical protein LCGC14_2112830, partial [marine sediment metagenome]
MVNYPTSLDNDSTLYLVADNVDDYLAIHHNALKDAVVALETVVGITGAFNFADVSHAMTSHSDDDSYDISTSGTFAFGAAAEDLDMGGFDITGIVQLVASTTAEAKIEMFETNAVNEGSAYLQMGVSDNNKWIMQGYHDGSGDLTELRITTTSIGGASAAGFGDIVFLPDTVEKMRLTADGNLTISGTVDGVDIAARDHAETHSMASHSDDDTYNISTTGTAQISGLTVTSTAGTLITISNSSSQRAGLTIYTVNDEPNELNFGVNSQFNRYSFSAR